jgi:hypothetical protein
MLHVARPIVPSVSPTLSGLLKPSTWPSLSPSPTQTASHPPSALTPSHAAKPSLQPSLPRAPSASSAALNQEANPLPPRGLSGLTGTLLLDLDNENSLSMKRLQERRM